MSRRCGRNKLRKTIYTVMASINIIVGWKGMQAVTANVGNAKAFTRVHLPEDQGGELSSNKSHITDREGFWI